MTDKLRQRRRVVADIAWSFEWKTVLFIVGMVCTSQESCRVSIFITNHIKQYVLLELASKEEKDSYRGSVIKLYIVIVKETKREMTILTKPH